MRVIAALLLCCISSAAFAGDPVKVHFRWDHTDAPLDGYSVDDFPDFSYSITHVVNGQVRTDVGTVYPKRHAHEIGPFAKLIDDGGYRTLLPNVDRPFVLRLSAPVQGAFLNPYVWPYVGLIWHEPLWHGSQTIYGTGTIDAYFGAWQED